MQKIAYAKKLRQRMTPAEKILWSALRNSRLSGFKFKRQVPFGPFIVDFCCIRQKLILEIDGAIHKERREYDQERTRLLSEQGYRVIRISNEEVEKSLMKALQKIQQEILNGVPLSSRNLERG
jgi:very-short-patch-repair endonuclease